MAEKNAVLSYLRTDELLKSSKKTSIKEEVMAEMREERKDSILDMCFVRIQEDWSYLADKTVGAEGNS